MCKTHKRAENIGMRSKDPQNQTTIVNIRLLPIWNFIPSLCVNPGQRLQAPSAGFLHPNDTVMFCMGTWTSEHSSGIQFAFQVKVNHSYSGHSITVSNSFLTQIQVIWVSVIIIQGWYAAGIRTTGQGHLLTIPDAIQHSNRITQECLCNVRITSYAPLAESQFSSATILKFIFAGYCPGQNWKDLPRTRPCHPHRAYFQH